MSRLLCIAAGGAVGSVVRHAAIEAIKSLAGDRWPWGTLCVNLLGCLCLGLLAGLFVRHPQVRVEVQLGLMSGLLGGFTTFSTFALEAFRLGQQGEAFFAVLYVLVSCVLGVAAAAIGFHAAARRGAVRE